jgi:hypothetical protein
MDLAFPAAICDPALDDLKSVTSACQNPAELKDAHVVATAVSSGASAIITYNLKDFNGRWLKPFGLEAITPETTKRSCNAKNSLVGFTTTR